MLYLLMAYLSPGFFVDQWLSLLQAGLTRRHTFRLVTHPSLTVVCVRGMLYLGRKETQRHHEKENITDFP